MPEIGATAAYLITLKNDKNFAATVYPSRQSAEKAFDHLLGGDAGWVVQTEEDLASMSGKLLVDVFNGLTNSDISKFENRAVGTKRLLSVLPQVAIKPTNRKEKTVSDTETKKGRQPINASHPTRSDWKKIRSGSMRARIAGAMFTGAASIDEIAAAADVPADRVLPHIYATAKDAGVGYHVEDGKYRLDVPPGVTSFEQLLAEEKAPVQKQAAE